MKMTVYIPNHVVPELIRLAREMGAEVEKPQHAARFLLGAIVVEKVLGLKPSPGTVSLLFSGMGVDEIRKLARTIADALPQR